MDPLTWFTNLHPDTKRWIGTTLLALYGAVLATYREIVARRANRIALQIELTAPAGEESFPNSHIRLTITNIGRRCVPTSTRLVPASAARKEPHGFGVWTQHLDIEG